MIKNITIVLILILGSFLIGKFACKSKSDISISKVKIDTQYVYNDTNINQHNLIYIHDTERIKLPKEIDTIKVIDSFYATNDYIDSLNFRGNELVIKDTVSQNKIEGSSIKIENKTTLVTDSLTIKSKPKLNIYIGPTYYTNGEYGVNGYFIYNWIGVNVGLSTQPAASVGLIIKIK